MSSTKGRKNIYLIFGGVITVLLIVIGVNLFILLNTNQNVDNNSDTDSAEMAQNESNTEEILDESEINLTESDVSIDVNGNEIVVDEDFVNSISEINLTIFTDIATSTTDNSNCGLEITSNSGESLLYGLETVVFGEKEDSVLLCKEKARNLFDTLGEEVQVNISPTFPLVFEEFTSKNAAHLIGRTFIGQTVNQEYSIIAGVSYQLEQSFVVVTKNPQYVLENFNIDKNIEPNNAQITEIPQLRVPQIEGWDMVIQPFNEDPQDVYKSYSIEYSKYIDESLYATLDIELIPKNQAECKKVIPEREYIWYEFDNDLISQPFDNLQISRSGQLFSFLEGVGNGSLGECKTISSLWQPIEGTDYAEQFGLEGNVEYEVIMVLNLKENPYDPEFNEEIKPVIEAIL